VAEKTFLKLQQDVLFIVHGTTDTTSVNVSSVMLDRAKEAINRALTLAMGLVRTTHARRRGTITLVASQSDYDLPTRCTAIIADTVYSSINPEFALQHVTEQEWTRLGGQANTDEGPPSVYTDFKYNTSTKVLVLTLHRTPGTAEAGETVNFQYTESPAEMTADADIPPLPQHLHDGLIAGACVLGFAQYLDRDVLQVHASAWATYLKVLSRNNSQIVGQKSIMRGRRQTTINPLGNIGWPLS